MKVLTQGLKAVKAEYADFVINENNGSDEVSDTKLYEIGYLAYYSYMQTKADYERAIKGLSTFKIRAEEAEQRVKELEYDNARIYGLLGRLIDKVDKLENKVFNLDCLLLSFEEKEMNQDELIEALTEEIRQSVG